MNWKNEIKKWMGDDRIRVFAVDHKTNVKHFTVGRASHVMVIGYEKVFFSFACLLTIISQFKSIISSVVATRMSLLQKSISSSVMKDIVSRMGKYRSLKL